MLQCLVSTFTGLKQHIRAMPLLQTTCINDMGLYFAGNYHIIIPLILKLSEIWSLLLHYFIEQMYKCLHSWLPVKKQTSGKVLTFIAFSSILFYFLSKINMVIGVIATSQDKNVLNAFLFPQQLNTKQPVPLLQKCCCTAPAC